MQHLRFQSVDLLSSISLMHTDKSKCVIPHLHSRISCRISPFLWVGGELKDFRGWGSSLGVKNKVSTNLGGGSN